MFDITTASPQERKAVYDAVAAELGDDRFFTTKELDVLPKILAPMEQVLSFSSGLMDGNTWLIVLTDRRILFLDKGLLYGLKQTSIDLENVVVIEGSTGLVFGSISISTAAGPREIRNTWKRSVNAFINKVNEARRAQREGRQLLSPGSGENFPSEQRSPLRDLTPTPTPAPRSAYEPPCVDPAPAPTSGSDSEAALARLDRLLRAGAVTREEYDRQRAQILR